MADLRNPKTQIEIRFLLTNVRQGDESSIVRMIEIHKDYARRIAYKFSYKLPNLKDDITSAAILGLVQAVRWLADGRGYDKNISGYIIKTVKRFIFECADDSYTIMVPGTSVRKLGKTRVMTVSYNNPSSLKSKIELLDSKDYRRWAEPYLVQKKVQENFDKEIAEHLEGIHLTLREKMVIDFRLQGFTDKEIGAKLYVSDVMIFKIRQELQNRFNFLLEDRKHG